LSGTRTCRSNGFDPSTIRPIRAPDLWSDASSRLVFGSVAAQKSEQSAKFDRRIETLDYMRYPGDSRTAQM
ncbi:hypothetical protein, partial [Rhodococcus sp. (in: high G+C Gram-positive bacteria)]|uniref:hypothetical protein n=1 Tax=Rhodococcus sp. TaxID=1831 RepID=UPI00257AD98C